MKIVILFVLLFSMVAKATFPGTFKEQLVGLIAEQKFQEARELVKQHPPADLETELIASPELSYNLGYLYWNVEIPGKAISYWLRFLRYTRSPEEMWTVLNQIRSIENESAIPSSVGKSLWFPVFLVANNYYILLLLNVVLWATIFWLLFLLYYPQRLFSRRIFASLGLLCAGLAGTLYLFDLKRPRIAVIDKDNEAVGVFKNSQLSSDGQLVEVPSGTIVILGREKEKSIEILSPFSGWVNRTEVLDSI